ncbi:WD40-repeat protein [Cryptosporidium bovis]|uniref:WD40-repeat protein n=1 Tax=Cryptosporidium bovis TaxID=310047 RepID=UPI00351A4E41|nr:WD40-repeat protein [Cryptosporidium bovis]
MIPFLICHFLKEYGMDDLSEMVYQRLFDVGKITKRIDLDGLERQMSFNDFLNSVPACIIDVVTTYLTFFDRCRYRDCGEIGIENLIRNKDELVKLTSNIICGLEEYSKIYDGIDEICNSNVFFGLRSFYNDFFEFNSFSTLKFTHFFNKFCGDFINCSIVYSHQHIVDSEYGFVGDPAGIYLIKKDNTGNVLISGGDDGVLRLWNIYTGNLITSIKKNAGDITDFDVNSCNALVASCCGKGELILSIVIGNEWLPLAVISNQDRLTCIKFGYSKHNNMLQKDQIFQESELLISGGDSAIISIYKVKDLFMNGVSHFLSKNRLRKWRENTFEKFYKVFEKYESLLYSSYYSKNDNSLFYQSPPLYRIDLFPLSPKAFDICLNPVYNPGYSSCHYEEEYILFSIGASLDPKNSCEEIKIHVMKNNFEAEYFRILRDPWDNGYALVFIIPLDCDKKLQLLDIPCKYCDSPDVSFANNSQDLVIASDGGKINLWVTQRTTVCYYYSLVTYITERIVSDSYSKRRSIVNINMNTDESDNENLPCSDGGSIDELSPLEISSVNNSRFVFREVPCNNKASNLNSTLNSNLVEFIDFVQWSCDDSFIIVANSVAQKSSLKRQKNTNSIVCVETCVSYFSRKNMKRVLDIVLPDTSSRTCNLIAHPLDPGIALCLTYGGGVFVTTLKEQINSIRPHMYTHILFEHKCPDNPYLNGTWLKNGLGFVISQKLGSLEFYYICNNQNGCGNILTQTYRFSLTEQLFLGDFCEMRKDQTFWLINPNTRKPLHFFPRSVIVNKSKKMYAELLQPPVPKESSLGLTVNETLKFTSDLYPERMPYFDKLGSRSQVELASKLYLERTKKRMLYREKKYAELLQTNKSKYYPEKIMYEQLDNNQLIDEEFHSEVIESDNHSRYDNEYRGHNCNNEYEHDNDNIYDNDNIINKKKRVIRSESYKKIKYPHFIFNEENFDILIQNYDMIIGDQLEIESATSELALNDALFRPVKERKRNSREDFNIKVTNSYVQNTDSVDSEQINGDNRVSPAIIDYGTPQFSSISESEDDSSLSDQTISDENETENDSDLTSEDSLYNEIIVNTSNNANRRANRRLNSYDSMSDYEDNKFEYRYYETQNLDFLWMPDCEDTQNNIVCKLCNIGSTTIIGYDYLFKSNIENMPKLSRPVLHGVNGSIDFGPLIGPFNYFKSTKKANDNPNNNTSSGEEFENNNFYLHTRCLITIPFLYWEVIKEKIYTNIFDIVKKMYNPGLNHSRISNTEFTSTFFDTSLVVFPKTIKNCSFCNKYGATILCQGKKCNQQFHYHCSSLAFHSFPEYINSNYISPRESDFYWCDVMSFFIFYCPKCIQMKNSNVPYKANRENMVNSGEADNCKRDWLSSEAIVSYAPQINDSLYFFPGPHYTTALDDLFFKQLFFSEDSQKTNKRYTVKNNVKCDYVKCKLINISYSFPGRMESKIIAILTFSTCLSSGKVVFWQLRYSANDGPDYLVLEDDFERGLHNLYNRFRPGQEGFIFVDNDWHEVVIKGISTGSVWESIEISWKVETENCNSLMVNPWEISEHAYPENNRKIDNVDNLRRIFTWVTTQTIGSLPFSFIDVFKNPIPYYSKKKSGSSPLYSNDVWVMHYWKEVPLPLCLSKMIERINRNYYRKLEGLVSDILLIRSNCEHFNMNNNYFVQGIRTIEYELLRLIFGRRLPRYILNGSSSLSEVKEEKNLERGHNSHISTKTESAPISKAHKRRANE